MTKDISKILKNISQKPQRQDGVADQLVDIIALADKLGMDDAAEKIQTLIEVQRAKYDSNFGDDVICKCGHPYYRHFDTYENMYPVGCKYCECFTFIDILY